MSKNNSDLSRRKFMVTSAAGLMSLGLAGVAPGVASADTPAEVEAKKEIILRELGKSKVKLPVVSMGAGACNDPGLVQAAFELGVRHFDSAANYQVGANEQMIGMVLKKMGVRDQANIGTKIYTPQQRRDYTAEQLKKKLEDLTDGSLKRLNTDYIDILYIHDINSREVAGDPKLGEAMAYLKEKGKARLIGLSTHSNMAEVIDEAANTENWDVILTSYNFTMIDDTAIHAAIERAGKKGIGFIAMKVMAGGGRWPNPETRRNFDNTTITGALLKWCLSNKYFTTVIPAFGNYEHMNLDIAIATDLEYTEQERNFLSDNDIKLGMGFCRQCQQCLASCPEGIDIPNLMRTHMYAAQYGDFYLARDTYKAIAAEKSLTACTGCADCLAQCANTVDISRRIQELKLIYS